MHDVTETPAEKVIRLFGGEKAVAEITGLSTVQIHRWRYPKEKKGHGGHIPTRHIPTLLAAAANRQIPLTFADLLPPDLAECLG